MPLLPPEVNSSPHNRTIVLRALVPSFCYFLVAGATTVMLGPLLPALMQHWHIQDAQAGTLFTADFLGQLCGAWFAARRLRASLLYGAVLSAVGCIAIAWVSFGMAHIALFCLGLGLGGGLTAGNIIVGTTVPSSRASLLTMLNLTWGLGAIACPALIHLTINRGGVQSFFYLIALCLAITALFSIAVPHSVQSADISRTATTPTSDAKPLTTRLPLPIMPLLAFASAMFLYVGIENSLGGWLPSYAIRTNPILQAASISLIFWIAELIGRLLSAALMRFIKEATLYRYSLVLLIFTEVVLCTATHLSANSVIALTILAALSLAPLYPLITAFLLARTGNHTRLGPIFASASFGGAMLPWLTGVSSTAFHGLRAGLVIPAAGAVFLLVLSTIITSDKATPAFV